LKTEIRMNLEFLADRSVLSSGCEAEHYQFHLLHLSYHKAAAKITNNFNVSLLKKRIFMMNKKQTSHRSIWKYALILPVLAVLLFFNSALQTKAEPVNEMNSVQQVPAKTQVKPVAAKASNVQQAPQKAQDKPATAKDSKEIFAHVEVMPKFPGGQAALLKFLSDNIVYPKEAQDKGIQGKVQLRFVVKPDGSIDDIQVIKSLNPILDNEAVRVLKLMPNWIPGKQTGKPVYVYFSLPVMFKLQGNTNKTGTTQQKSVNAKNEPVANNSKPEIISHVEVKPEFPGGQKTLMKWLSARVNYPKEAQDKGIQGRVTLRFGIKPDGSVDDVQVVEGLDPLCDQEAVRVAKLMPKWIPGKQDGKPVYVYSSMPVTFKLQVQETTAKPAEK